MKILRKIAAILVMILAVVGVLLCVGGLVGAWAVNQPATNAVTGLLGTASDYLGLASQATQTAGSTVSDVTQRLDALGQAATSLSADRKAQIDARVAEITQPIARISTLTATASQGLSSLDSTLNRLDRIPGLDVPQPQADLGGISTRLDAVSTKLDALHTTVNSAALDGQRVQGATTALSSELQGVQTELSRWSSGIGQRQAAIQSVSNRVPGLIDLASVAATLFVLLFGAGQVSLFIHALQWFRKP
jgi:uncharacterized phage infection (PIP) family protein YhgE